MLKSKLREVTATDRDKRLWDLLVLHNANRIDYNNRKWETIKFSQSIISALLAASLAAIYAVAEKSIPLPLYNCILILPTIAAVASILAIFNLKRESRLLFLEELQMNKIAKLIGLDIEVAESKRWLPGDPHLLLHKWRSTEYGAGKENLATVDEWLDARTSRHSFYSGYVGIFLVQLAASLTIIGAVLLPR